MLPLPPPPQAQTSMYNRVMVTFKMIEQNKVIIVDNGNTIMAKKNPVPYWSTLYALIVYVKGHVCSNSL